MSDSGSTAGRPWLKQVGVWAVVVLVAFLAGLVPMWFAARETMTTLRATERDLDRARLETALGFATIAARRGDYEPARQATSIFYTTLDATLSSPESPFTPAERDGLRELIAERDDLITLLARRDPASADRLAELYMRYRTIVSPPTAQ